MKKPSLIIGKKQIILACLTLMLGTAVYVNYILADGGSQNEMLSYDGESENYGDTKFVNGTEETQSVSVDDWFAQARIDRTASRDTSVQELQMMLGGGDLTEDEMVSKALQAVELSRMGESETTIETLIKSKGFEDCIVYLETDSAAIVVKSDGLTDADAAAIKEIILGEVSIPASNIRIYELGSGSDISNLEIQ